MRHGTLLSCAAKFIPASAFQNRFQLPHQIPQVLSPTMSSWLMPILDSLSAILMVCEHPGLPISTHKQARILSKRPSFRPNPALAQAYSACHPPKTSMSSWLAAPIHPHGAQPASPKSAGIGRWLGHCTLLLTSCHGLVWYFTWALEHRHALNHSAALLAPTGGRCLVLGMTAGCPASIM